MTETPVVRVATPDDAEAFAACHVACWQEAYGDLWGPERFADLDVARIAVRRREEIEAGEATYVLAELHGEVIGIAISGPTRDDDAPVATELYAIYVRAANQGSGLADMLLTATVAEGPAALWVYRDNPRATAFYVNHGFIPDGSQRNDTQNIQEIRMVRR